MTQFSPLSEDDETGSECLTPEPRLGYSQTKNLPLLYSGSIVTVFSKG